MATKSIIKNVNIKGRKQISQLVSALEHAHEYRGEEVIMTRAVSEVKGEKINKFFENYIGCSQSMCSKWLKGERKLNSEQIRKTHEFLSGKHIKTVEDILKGE